MIADLFFIAEQTFEDDKDSMKKLFFKLHLLELSSEEIFCNVDLFSEKTEMNIGSSRCELFVPIINISQDCSSILHVIEVMKNHIYSYLLEDDIIEILSVLENNSYIKKLSSIDANYFIENNLLYICNCRFLDMAELFFVSRNLRKLPIGSFRYQISIST